MLPQLRAALPAAAMFVEGRDRPEKHIRASVRRANRKMA